MADRGDSLLADETSARLPRQFFETHVRHEPETPLERLSQLVRVVAVYSTAGQQLSVTQR